MLMDRFEIQKDEGRPQSINRTIRLQAEVFDRLMELSQKNGVSFNKIINQCIEFALAHMDE